MSKSPVVGVAGCGSMGLPMAQALQHAGYEVWGLDVRPASEFGSLQLRVLADPTEFASRVQVVISAVRDVTQSRELCFDRQALFARAQYPGTLIVSSTLSPRFMPDLRSRLPVGPAVCIIATARYETKKRTSQKRDLFEE